MNSRLFLSSTIKENQIIYYLASFLAGALILSAFSLIQKMMLGISDIFVLKGFFIPVLFGGLVGLMLMRLYTQISINTDYLKESREKLQDFLDNASDLIQSVDAKGRFTYVNAAWRNALQYEPEDFAEITVFDIIRSDHLAHCQSIFTKIVSGEHINNVETVFIAKDGTDIHVVGNLNCRMENGIPISTRGIFRDITSQYKALEQARLAAKVFESAQEAILVTDPKGGILTTNAAFSSITGYSATEVIGEPVYKILGSEDGQLSDSREAVLSLHRNKNWDGEMIGHRKNGEAFEMRAAISLIRDDGGRITNYVGIFSDVTDQKQMEKRLEHLATHDFLTDLPNRALFQKRLEESITSAEQNGSMLAVLFLDLDVFKSVNDRFGHAFGDQLMRDLSARLRNCVRKSDLVARMGGDEFAVILEYISDVNQAVKIAEKIVNSMQKPFEIQGKSVEATFSIGISTYPESSDARSLLTNADFAMYQAKESGRNTFRVY